MIHDSCNLSLNKQFKELNPHGTLAFPCAGYAAHYTDRPEDVISWHWHEELEFIYAAQGRMEVRTPSQTFYLEAGDCLLLNGNVLHEVAASPACDLRSFVFSPLLITGQADSDFARKYVTPLMASPAFTGCLLRVDGCFPEREWFCEAFAAMAEEHCGFEFTVRENLSRICLGLYQRYEPRLDAPGRALNQDSQRVKIMLAYLHGHFAEDVALADVAHAAGISERECLRCFQKTIHLSPIQYLLKYRVMQGAAMLTAEPHRSISDIAARCGFDSQSNFAMVFRRFYRCAPREYRQGREGKTAGTV